ncbi:Lrp/AsnC family transcriptional regulator [Marivita sp. S2033]|uniref:Lrp/AsnC family transcriptional regulator n=1 Tax=Marivita sp. S2033 TaxID=3373187 RepID=UPI00398296FA
MDETDRQLISALRHDGRASVSDLATLLSLSRATVRARLDRLRQSGEVVGYTVVLRQDTARDPVRALMMIGIEGRGTDRVIRLLSGLPQVRGLHSTNGRWDVIAELGTDTLEALDDVLSRIRKIDGVTQSETSLLLATRKSAL